MKKINGAVLHSLINSVYLGGIINEAVLCVDDGVAQMQAIHQTNMLLVSNRLDLKVPDMKIGITEIGLISKLLGTGDEVKYELSGKGDDQWMKLNIKNKGNVKLLLTDSELISTYVDNELAADEMLESYETEGIELNKEMIDKILYFINMFKPTSLLVCVDSKSKLEIKSIPTEIKQFKIPVGKMEDCEDIEIEIYVDHLSAILTQAKESKEELLLLLKDSDHPVILLQDDCVWALSPIDETTSDSITNQEDDEDDIPQ